MFVVGLDHESVTKMFLSLFDDTSLLVLPEIMSGAELRTNTPATPVSTLPSTLLRTEWTHNTSDAFSDVTKVLNSLFVCFLS